MKCISFSGSVISWFASASPALAPTHAAAVLVGTGRVGLYVSGDAVDEIVGGNSRQQSSLVSTLELLGCCMVGTWFCPGLGFLTRGDGGAKSADSGREGVARVRLAMSVELQRYVVFSCLELLKIRHAVGAVEQTTLYIPQLLYLRACCT